MPPHHTSCSEGKQHAARASSEASTVPMSSRCASSATEQREDASSDADVAHVMLNLRLFDVRLRSHSDASASSAPDDHVASPRQQAATHLARPCATSASTDDVVRTCVRTPSNDCVRSMLSLMNASCDPASHRGAWGNLEENVVARNILRTAAAGAAMVGRGTRGQWLCALTADEWLTRALAHCNQVAA